MNLKRIFQNSSLIAAFEMLFVCTFRSYRYSSYRQFIWWVFDRLGKKNRRVVPSCVLWKIRNFFPEENGVYVNYEDGKKD